MGDEWEGEEKAGESIGDFFITIVVFIIVILIIGVTCSIVSDLSPNPDAGRYTPEDYEYWQEAPEGQYYD